MAKTTQCCDCTVCTGDALEILFQQKVLTTGAGRTDTGVHARRLVVHVDLPEGQQTDLLQRKLNRLLPADVSVDRVCKVKAGAHARFDAVERTYRYWLGQRKMPLCRDYVWRVEAPLDFEEMNVAAEALLG